MIEIDENLNTTVIPTPLMEGADDPDETRGFEVNSAAIIDDIFYRVESELRIREMKGPIVVTFELFENQKARKLIEMYGTLIGINWRNRTRIYWVDTL